MPLAVMVPPAVLVLSSVMVSPAPVATTVSAPVPPSTVRLASVSGVAAVHLGTGVVLGEVTIA